MAGGFDLPKIKFFFILFLSETQMRFRLMLSSMYVRRLRRRHEISFFFVFSETTDASSCKI